MYGEIEGTMDSGLEERILPSIRRSQMLLIYRNGGVVGQVAHFNLTPEASLCRGFYLLPFVLSKGSICTDREQAYPILRR